MCRKSIFSFIFLIVAASSAHPAELKHVFRRRIEACESMNGCGAAEAIPGAPVISGIHDITVRLGEVIPPLTFQANDTDTPASGLSVTINSATPDIFPGLPPHVVLSGYGNLWNLGLSPLSGKTGTATFSVSASDGLHADSREFTVTILPPSPSAPWISPVADIVAIVNEPISPVILEVGDGGDNPTSASELDVTVMNTNFDLLGMPTVEEGTIASQRSISFLPTPDTTGEANLYVFVTDTEGEYSYINFRISIVPPPSSPIISPVDDIVATVGDPLSPVTITISDRGENPTPPEDLDVVAFSGDTVLIPTLAVTPGINPGERIISIQPAADKTGFSEILLTATDADGETATETFLVTIIDKPWPGPVFLAPFSDMEVTLGEEIPTIPVHVEDRGTPPTAPEDIHVWASTGGSPNILLVDDGTGNLGDTEISLPMPDAGDPGGRALQVVAAPQLGVSTVNVGAMDGDGFVATESFNIRVINPANTPPTLGSIPDIAINQDTTNVAITPWLTFSDAQTSYCSLAITASSSNQQVLPDSAIVVENSFCNKRLRTTPPAGKWGETVITVTVQDAGFRAATASFTLRVNAKPVIDPIFMGPAPFTTLGNYNRFPYQTMLGAYQDTCDMPKMFFPIRIYDPDNYPSPLAITLPASWCLDPAQTELRQVSGSLHEIGFRGASGCGPMGVASTQTFQVSDGMASISPNYRVDIYYCPKTVSWVQIPATTLPGGVSVPAFSVRQESVFMSDWGLDSARKNCKYGREYDLISDRQWLAIANLALPLADNWTGTGVTIGTAYLADFGSGVGLPIRGHSDNTEGWMCNQAAPVSTYFTNGAMAYNCTNNNISQLPGTTSGTGSDQRRTTVLPDGNFIFDFVGTRPNYILCDGTNPACVNGYVKPGTSYTGLAFGTGAHNFSDPGIQHTWLKPPLEFRDTPALGNIWENADTTNPRYLIRSAAWKDPGPAFSGLFSLRHLDAITDTGSAYAARCVGPATPPNVAIANTRPTISALADQEVESGNSISVPFTVGDAESAATTLTVRAFMKPENGLPITISGTDAARTLTINTTMGAPPEARTVTIVVSDPSGAATTRSFRLMEVESASNICSFNVSPSSHTFSIGVHQLNLTYYDHHILTIINTGTVPIWGGFQTENVPVWLRVVIPQGGGTEWCPITGIDGRPLYPGESCQILMLPEYDTEGSYDAIMNVVASCGGPKSVNLHLDAECTYYSDPVPCPTAKCSGTGCFVDCPEGNCVVECPQGGCRINCTGGGCRTICTGGGCDNKCVGGGCANVCTGGNCKNRCLGGGCENICEGGGCENICEGGNCINTCIGGNCINTCVGGGCTGDGGGGGCGCVLGDDMVSDPFTLSDLGYSGNLPVSVSGAGQISTDGGSTWQQGAVVGSDGEIMVKGPADSTCSSSVDLEIGGETTTIRMTMGCEDDPCTPGDYNPLTGYCSGAQLVDDDGGGDEGGGGDVTGQGLGWWTPQAVCCSTCGSMYGSGNIFYFFCIRVVGCPCTCVPGGLFDGICK